MHAPTSANDTHSHGRTHSPTPPTAPAVEPTPPSTNGSEMADRQPACAGGRQQMVFSMSPGP
jgi:hypothetical protein